MKGTKDSSLKQRMLELVLGMYVILSAYISTLEIKAFIARYMGIMVQHPDYLSPNVAKAIPLIWLFVGVLLGGYFIVKAIIEEVKALY